MVPLSRAQHKELYPFVISERQAKEKWMSPALIFATERLSQL